MLTHPQKNKLRYLALQLKIIFYSKTAQSLTNSTKGLSSNSLLEKTMVGMTQMIQGSDSNQTHLSLKI
jgi:hypothetical protein